MDTKLFVRKQAGGLFSILDRADFPEGSIWWVDSTNAAASDSAGFGKNPDAPFATLVYAETQASAGDTIFVLPGHTETLTGDPSLTLDVAGLSVIGLGGATRKPAFLVDGAATAHIVISGADTLLENVTLKAGHADVAKAILVSADGVTIRRCTFLENAADENFVICILGGATNACDFLTVEDCFAIEDDAANTHFLSLPNAENGVIVRRNLLHGDWGTAAIGAAGVLTFCTVADNWIYNRAADNDSCINLADNTSGICVRNLVANAAVQANQITTGDTTACENYAGVISEDLQGILDPTAT